MDRFERRSGLRGQRTPRGQTEKEERRRRRGSEAHLIDGSDAVLRVCYPNDSNDSNDSNVQLTRVNVTGRDVPSGERSVPSITLPFTLPVNSRVPFDSVRSFPRRRPVTVV